MSKETPIIPTEIDGTLSYSVWVTNGTMKVNRDYLDYDHPENTYNHLKSHGITPEHYGIVHPLVEMKRHLFDHKSRDELVLEILRLQKDLEAVEKWL